MVPREHRQHGRRPRPHRCHKSWEEGTLWSYLFASFSRSSYRSSVSWYSRLSLRAHLSLGGCRGKEARCKYMVTPALHKAAEGRCFHSLQNMLVPFLSQKSKIITKYFKTSINKKYLLQFTKVSLKNPFLKRRPNGEIRNMLRDLERSRLAKLSDCLAMSCFGVKMPV